MTRKQIVNRVGYWLEHPALEPLGVAHWDMTVGFVPQPGGNPNANAAMQNSFQYDYGTLEIEEEYAEKAGKESLDRTIVHEIIHCVFRDLSASFHELTPFVSRDAAEIYGSRVDFEAEGIIDRIARAIVALDYAKKS